LTARGPVGDRPVTRCERFVPKRGARKTLSLGTPRFDPPELAAVAANEGVEAAWQLAYARFGARAPLHVDGNYAVALRDDDGRIFAAVDRFAVRPLCFRRDGDEIIVAERADDAAAKTTGIQPQAIFDYLYFHAIPAPRTIFDDVFRLSAGTSITFWNGTVETHRWWTPTFVERETRPFRELRSEFRAILRESVARQTGPGVTGCFLSGGTDSSTVAGMLRDVTGDAPNTFSIGFDAAGYDEMAYAKIAARHFGARHHEYYVTPDDLVASLPQVAAFYDQPFGNSSVVPAYYCASMARNAGMAKILAGDGGDELFGGNTRYAKQRVFEIYENVPRLLRTHVLERIFDERSAFGKLRPFSKAASYIAQARTPLPDRMQMYNLLARIGHHEIFVPEFLSAVDVDDPARQQRVTFAGVDAASLVNRMLGFDWKYTLADNDLPKVVGATSLAGLPAGFPLLDARLVEFSLRLAPALKLKRLTLRWFFKEALRGYLPDEILAKQKHGFGLPFGPWLMRGGALLDMAAASLDGLAKRGIVRPEFLQRLIRDLLPSAPGYYGELVWILMMLEEWWGRHDSRAARARQPAPI